MNSCIHENTTVINQHDIVRKYRCNDCGKVMMCSCDKKYGEKFLPHQLTWVLDRNTMERIPVTHGFQEKICNTCKGLPEEAHPIKAGYGYTSKIQRYYWREIWRLTTIRFAAWAEMQGYPSNYQAIGKHPGVHKRIKKEVTDEIKKIHAQSPKYVFNDVSEEKFLKEHPVEQIILHAEKDLANKDKKAHVFHEGKSYTVEDFVQIYYQKKGYKTLTVESRPWHVIFGIYMHLLIEDPFDEKNDKPKGFGNRDDFDNKVKPSRLIWMFKPDDFGSAYYAKRRKKAIIKYFKEMVPKNKSNYMWTFDYSLPHSENFRQYLWAHRKEDIAVAKTLIEVLPSDILTRVLRYLIEDYWNRYLGFPDLFVYNNEEFFFTEVKFSSDKLSGEQRNWIVGNETILHLPFKLVKVHNKK